MVTFDGALHILCKLKLLRVYFQLCRYCHEFSHFYLCTLQNIFFRSPNMIIICVFAFGHYGVMKKNTHYLYIQLQISAFVRTTSNSVSN